MLSRCYTIIQFTSNFEKIFKCVFSQKSNFENRRFSSWTLKMSNSSDAKNFRLWLHFLFCT